MAKRYKPGDIVTMRVLSVEPSLMVVNLDGIRMELAMPDRPMTHKQLKAQMEKIAATWKKHYGKTVEFQVSKLVQS
jgi:hypothetical protein